MLELLKQPWSWWAAGIIIGLTVPTLLILGNKSFGISSSMRHLCAMCFPAKLPFFNYDWKKEIWNIFFIVGVAIGGFVAVQFLGNDEPVKIAAETQQELREQGVSSFGELLPADIFSWESLLTLRGFIFMVIGGFMVGFGTRWAGGCTSGHAIMGLSNLQWPSLVATISFMVGGFFMTWVILPFLLGL
ncbi:MAG: YeeE/YedE family protein [Bacteroidia bacterium]|nr:YeeE/YedE family protein [Bacteroidia bacterium]